MIEPHYYITCDECGATIEWEPDGVNQMPEGWYALFDENEDEEEFHVCASCYDVRTPQPHGSRD